MKRYVILMALALSLAMPTSAFALEVPSETIVQNLNGSQQVIKTYTISPGADPQELIEEPFTLEGYRYTFADIVKVENHVQDSRQQTETVTVETSKNDLGLILEKLAPTLDYDDGQYCGKLALDQYLYRSGRLHNKELQRHRNEDHWPAGPQRHVLCSCYDSKRWSDAQTIQCGMAGYRNRSGRRGIDAIFLSGSGYLQRKSLL